jgi:hypothetical protein
MNWARLFFGSVVAALGAILVLDATGVAEAGSIIGAWWPVVVLGAGILAWLANPRHWLIPGVITLLGIALLLWTTDVVDTLDLVLPALLIVVGLAVIFGRSSRLPTNAKGDSISSFNVFSGSEVASHSQTFQGGNVGAVFGGTEIDLRDASPAPGAELDVFVAFGGAEVKVPEGWLVTTRGLPIFGGFDNVTAREKLTEDAPHLDINATVLFGGLEVKH